jgi:hypothetical protein
MSKEIKVGDKIVFGRGKKNKALTENYNIVIGKVYDVIECCDEEAIEIGEFYPRHLSSLEACNITKIVEA